MYKIRLVMLAAGSSIALASAALAGPTSTTSTTMGGGTTTTSSTIAGSTTTTTSTTATTAPSTTSTTSTTAPTTSSTTTTTLPSGDGDLSGQYPFVDEKSGVANTNFLNVDTSAGQVCLAGHVEAFDRTTFPNRSVTYTYDSSGTITKATDKKVKADSSSATLRLVISQVVTPPLPPEYDRTITTACKVKTSLLKEGAQDKVSLKCDELGENLSAFPDLTPALIENVANARLKRLKVNAKKGKLRISTVGVPTDAEIPVSCDFPPPTTTTTATSTTSTTSTTAPPTTSTTSTTPTTTSTTTTTGPP